MSQKENIKMYLCSGYSITPVEALELFGSFRLSERIREIQEDGFDIDKEDFILPSGAKVKRYWLKNQQLRLAL